MSITRGGGLNTRKRPRLKLQQPEEIGMALINQYKDLQVDDIYYHPPYPPGLNFEPKDEELIEYYLKPKVYGENVPCNIVIDADLYKYHPKELAEKFKSFVKDAWYVFTSRIRKYANGGRPNRSAGSGYWKATGSDQEIVDKDEQRIGYKKSLVYHEGRQPSKDKTGWMMHEYRIDGSRKRANPEDKTMLLDNWVLCKIYYKPVHQSGGSGDNGAVEKDTSLEENVEGNPKMQLEENPTEQPEKNPTKQPEENPTEQPEENPTEQPPQNSEPLAEPPLDLPFVDFRFMGSPKYYAMGLL